MPTPPTLDPMLAALIRMAVREDLGGRGISPKGAPDGDLTAELTIPQAQRSTANIVARSPGIVAGTFLLEPILRDYQVGMQLGILTPDATRVAPHQIIAQIAGSTRAILSAERVLLNFLGRLSGIATLTRQFVDAVSHTNPAPRICDTRKTTPGYRKLEKYAVVCGGGTNHRMGLYDGVMLKDNHLAALRAELGKTRTLAQLTAHVKQHLPGNVTLWLEVDTLDQLRNALPGGGADIILLDNFTPEQMRQAVAIRNDFNPTRRPYLEASGSVTLNTVAAIAATGVERISIGALTHSAPALDISMELA